MSGFGLNLICCYFRMVNCNCGFYFRPGQVGYVMIDSNLEAGAWLLLAGPVWSVVVLCIVRLEVEVWPLLLGYFKALPSLGRAALRNYISGVDKMYLELR